MSKVILITGASRGIGFCIAQAIAQRSESCCILVASRDVSSAENAISQLQDLKAIFQPVALDVTSDDNIKACLETIKSTHGRLDGKPSHQQQAKSHANNAPFKVLINNAAIATNPQSDHSDFRTTYNRILDTNITSAALLTTLAMPLLHNSPDPRVINISSARASIHNITTGSLPPTACVPYSVSKVALNALTLEMAKTYPDVSLYAANPGHCRTAFNGYTGKRDPVDVARVVVELTLAEKGVYGNGFWEFEEGGMREVAW
jgi:NAD(P)-dependent dehydrogenase (short-subunit alcohol dehydrogenase family)